MKIFVTGISTEVGKTITSAILTESLQADYWKPIQSGDLDNSDAQKVKNLITNKNTLIHPASYNLKTPASPHHSAEIDQITICTDDIVEPETRNHLVIEGAGGILVPLNDSDCIIDLIRKDYKVIIVSRHYLGSINHTLLTYEYLKRKNKNIAGLIFSGARNKATEEIILKKTSLPVIGHIEEEPFFDKSVISEYADLWKTNLNQI